MRISEVMQTEVQTVAPDALVQDAAVVLADAHVSALPLVDGAGGVIGVISRTDILASDSPNDAFLPPTAPSSARLTSRSGTT